MRSRDPRILILIGSAAVLAILVAVVAVGGAGGGDEGPPADPECVDAWNADRDALAYGRHNFGVHGYERVQVTRLTKDAADPPEGQRGLCAVIFGRLSLDDEPVAAGQLLIDGHWSPIAGQVDVELTRVAELQAIAAGDPNAELTGDGRLVAR